MQQLSSYQIPIWRNVYLRDIKGMTPSGTVTWIHGNRPFKNEIRKMGPLPCIQAFFWCLSQQPSVVALKVASFLPGSPSPPLAHGSIPPPSCAPLRCRWMPPRPLPSQTPRGAAFAPHRPGGEVAPSGPNSSKASPSTPHIHQKSAVRISPTHCGSSLRSHSARLSFSGLIYFLLNSFSYSLSSCRSSKG